MSAPLEVVHAFGKAGDAGREMVRSSTKDGTGSYLVMSMALPVPACDAYRAWVGFDQAPSFMRATSSCETFDDATVTWRLRSPAGEFAWQAKRCACVPCSHIVWKSLEGVSHPNFGAVSFEQLGAGASRMTIQAAFDIDQKNGRRGDPVPSLVPLLERSLNRFHHQLALS